MAQLSDEEPQMPYEELVKHRQGVRRGIADVVTASSRMEAQRTQLQRHIAEDTARGRLADLAGRIARLQHEIDMLDAQRVMLQAGEQRLTARINALTDGESGQR